MKISETWSEVKWFSAKKTAKKNSELKILRIKIEKMKFERDQLKICRHFDDIQAKFVL